MRKGLFKGYGGSTALRSWNFFARDILAEDPQGPILNQYVQNLQKQPESLGQKRGFVPLAEEVSGIERMPVDLVTGQIASAEGSTPAEISAEDLGGVNIDSEQDFNSIIANTQIWVDRGFGQWKLHRDFSPLR